MTDTEMTNDPSNNNSNNGGGHGNGRGPRTCNICGVAGHLAANCRSGQNGGGNQNQNQGRGQNRNQNGNGNQSQDQNGNGSQNQNRNQNGNGNQNQNRNQNGNGNQNGGAQRPDRSANAQPNGQCYMHEKSNHTNAECTNPRNKFYSGQRNNSNGNTQQNGGNGNGNGNAQQNNNAKEKKQSPQQNRHGNLRANRGPLPCTEYNYCERCNTEGHTANLCTRPPPAARSILTCLLCRHIGHSHNDCNHPRTCSYCMTVDQHGKNGCQAQTSVQAAFAPRRADRVAYEHRFEQIDPVSLVKDENNNLLNWNADQTDVYKPVHYPQSGFQKIIPQRPFIHDVAQVNQHCGFRPSAHNTSLPSKPVVWNFSAPNGGQTTKPNEVEEEYYKYLEQQRAGRRHSIAVKCANAYKMYGFSHLNEQILGGARFFGLCNPDDPSIVLPGGLQRTEAAERLFQYFINDSSFATAAAYVRNGWNFFRDPRALSAVARNATPRCHGCSSKGHILSAQFRRFENGTDVLTVDDWDVWGVMVMFRCACSGQQNYTFVDHNDVDMMI